MLRSNKKSKPRTLWFALALATVLATALALAGCYSSAGESKAPVAPKPVGTPAAIESVPASLEQFKGKVILLDLWATWCGPCRMEIPGFIKLQEKYRDKGLEIVGVSLDPVDSRGQGGAAAVGPFMQKMGINYTIWMVNRFEALGNYPLGQGYPTTYIIGRDGRTIKQYVGAQPESVFENDIKGLL
jgi:thiol-disulfide isomerase/thioredoxin